MTNPTQQEMIKKIYEEMADKELTVWCVVKFRNTPSWQKDKNLKYFCQQNCYVSSVDKNANNIIMTTKDSLWYSCHFNLTGHLDSFEDDCTYEDIGVKTIWHPLRIWDVMQRMEKYKSPPLDINRPEGKLNKPIPLHWWKEREELVTYIYSLIK